MIIDGIPLVLSLSKNKRFSMNLNTYRNMHYQVNNKIKKKFKEIIKHKCSIAGDIEIFPVVFKYYIYRKNKRKVDLMNIGSVVDKFTCDALVELGIIPDDNVDYISEVSFVDMGVDKQNSRALLKIEEV
jgi:hypothetical protein